jgi:hypothetical protein
MAKAERTAALINTTLLFTAEAQRTRRERREGNRRRSPTPLCEVSEVSAPAAVKDAQVICEKTFGHPHMKAIRSPYWAAKEASQPTTFSKDGNTLTGAWIYSGGGHNTVATGVK